VVVYYVIALALYMRCSYREVLRCLLEGVQWLMHPSAGIKVAGKSGISQARSRLGLEPVKRLYAAVVAPIAEKRTRGAWYRHWHLVSLDGSTLDVADTAENEHAFGRPGASRGSSAYPKIRFVGLLESGTHVLWAARMDPYKTDEITLATAVVPALRKGMLCLADRFFPAYNLWRKATQTGADLLWRVRRNARLEIDKRLADGSYLSRIYRSTSDRRNGRKAVVVRVIEYRLKDVPGAESVYRLITTILDPKLAPAKELAALYHERWEIETAFDYSTWCTPSYVNGISRASCFESAVVGVAVRFRSARHCSTSALRMTQGAPAQACIAGNCFDRINRKTVVCVTPRTLHASPTNISLRACRSPSR